MQAYVEEYRREVGDVAARAFPPLSPPSRPSATAAGFLATSSLILVPVVRAAILAAIWLRSFLGMAQFITCLSGQANVF